jgi:cytochrome c oxidase subunit 2
VSLGADTNVEGQALMAVTNLLARFIAAVTTLVGFANLAMAEPVAGQPVPWQMGFQKAATPVMAQINDFHNLVLVIITVIALFVLGLLIYVMIKFNAKANPTPSRTTHNTVIEVLWTVVPIMILVVIAIPSFRLLYYAVEVPADADMTVKAIGQSWQWEYEYPDEGFEFVAYMLQDDEREEGQPRLLATDNALVVPAGKKVRVLVTSDDVIHSWAVPSFGVKIDAVPGRLNETWFEVSEPGTYYGQCSELCGANHAFMPIEVRVVSEAEYQAWLVMARDEYDEIAGVRDTLEVADADQR